MARHYRTEMACTVEVLEDLFELYTITDGSIPGIAYLCRFVEGKPASTNHSELRWVTIDELKALDDGLFIPGLKDEFVRLVDRYTKTKR